MANNQTFTLNIKALFDASDIKAKVGDIEKAFSNLKLPDNLKKNLNDSFTSLNKALSDFESRTAKGVKTKTDAKGLTTSMDNVIKEFTNVQKIAAQVRAELGDSVDLSKIIKLDSNTINRLTELQKQAKKLKEEIANINTGKLEKLSGLLTKIKGDKTSAKAEEAFQFFKEGDIEGALQKIDQLIAKQRQLESGAANRTGTITTNIEELTKIRTEMADAAQQAQEKTKALGQVTQEQANVAKAAFDKEVQSVNNANQSLAEYGNKASAASGQVNDLATNQVRLNTELDQVKSKIQYFFGLANSINLVKRAIRSAFETVKELDAAMTETAVVTDHTISDMWKKLPEYTKRANQLGVSTLAAYQSATLYYQQGLNDNQAGELSVETLKMARIAGLEATEATDRMTNALRGFSMELNTIDAQRVDDVYSQLAAMSASNVDEISTAMTKVASLAHNANMEFETTAAFLAQIIETTRESAETAGTALKTVVARFSEVKKLYDLDELRGTDEEGQVVDVNKVSQALRTAGIDLNQYFLGEVGLDDIFMELASKWDSLTSVQQRYIATQAAGSRQQSRFIALMQDYARTQELVGAAYNAEGASARQFEKTQDSLQSKLERLKNAWNEFLMGITNSSIIKGVVDALTLLLNVINKITGAFGPAISGFLKFGVAAATIAGGKKAFSNGGIATKAIGALGNSPIGKVFGLGGNTNTQIAAAGTGFKAQVDAAGADFAAAVHGVTAAQTVGQTGTPAMQTLTLGQRLAQFKKNSINPYWYQDPKVQAAHLEYLNLRKNSPQDLEGISRARNNYINAKASAGGNGAKTLFGALGNKFVGTGFSAALGKIGIGSGAALSGAATLAATLGTITVAAGAAAIAIKAMYDASPAGQLKIAEKYADSMSDVAANAQKAASKIRDVAANTKEYEAAIKNATSTSDRAKAIQDQNEYILSLLEEDATYAQYIQSTFTEGGQLYLTLDSDALAAAVDKVAEGATRASAYSNFANAVQQQQMADVYRSRLADVDLENRTIYDWNTYSSRQLTDEEFAKYSKYQAQIDAANIAMQNYATTAASQLISLEDTNLDSELSNLVASVIGETFNADDVLTRARQTKRGNWWNGKATDTQLRAEYSRLYGSDLEKNYDKSEVQYAIALGQVLEEEIEGQVPDLLDTVRNANGKMLLEVISGSYDENVTNDQLKAAFDALNNEQKESIESLLGVSGNAVYDALNNYADNLRAAQVDFKKKAVATLKKAGLNNVKQLDQITNQLAISQQKKLVDIADSLTNYGTEFSGIILDQVSSAMLEGNYDATFESFVTQLSDNPVLTLQALKDAAESADPALQEVVKALGLIDKEGHFNTSGFEIFSKENLVQSFLMSDAFDNLTDQIEKFREENGQLNASNITALAAESKTLAVLLDNDIISANGLATALNALQDGNIAVSDLNENVLNLFDSFDSVSNAVQRAGQFIKDFDPGEDWGDAFDFIDNAVEKMTELVENRELGNPQLHNYWKAFFTTDPQDLADWEAGIALLKQLQGNGGADFWTDVIGFSMDETGNIADMGLEDFANSQFNSYRDYIRSLAEQNGFGDFTDEYYDLMIRNAANHDYGFIRDAAAVEVKKIVENYGDGLKDGAPTKADIQAMADAYNLDPQKILDAYTEKYNLDKLDFSQLEDQARQFNTKLEDLYEQVLRPDPNFVGPIQKTPEALFKAMGADANGNFSIDNLKLKIGQIVPEVADGSISAEDWFKEQVTENGGPVKLPVTYEVTSKTGEEQFKTETIHAEVEVTNLQEAEAAIQQLQDTANSNVLGASLISAFTDANTEAQALTDLVVTLGEQNGISNVTAAITVAESEAKSLNDTLSAPINKQVSITPLQSQINISGGGTTIQLGISVAALGGIVKSAANGTNNILSPGLALTGEEDPEIVWNKDKGYAYLAGKDGPEINNLKPGDQVFNAEQTKDILKRSGLKSFAKGNIKSYRNGTIWKTDDDSSGSGGGSGSGDKGNTKKESTWRNELDWLYDLMEDIAEYERQQNIIQARNELALEDIASSGRDLYKLTREELTNLETQLDGQQAAQLKRLQQMGELQTQVNAAGYGRYMQWNQQDQTLEIDWDAIEAIQDKETYDEVVDWLNRMESVQDQIDDAEDAMWDIKKQIQELQQRYLQKYLDFQNRVLDAIVKQYQDQIDKLSEINDNVNDTNASILDSIQREIDLERQIRDNTDVESDIANLEARLAYLQRDTTGANAAEIRSLQEQLTKARVNYGDTLIDQAVDRLAQSNEDAAAQREKQIELMQAQLDYWQESGGLWSEVEQLISTGFNGNGSLIRGSDLEKVLQNAENYEAMSQAQRDNWANELILETNQVGAHILELANGMNVNAEQIRALLANLTGVLGGTPEHSYTATKVEEKYATGGLNTYTGLAHLDGTPSAPEYVLNPEQTNAFLRLADVLPSIMSGDSIGGTTYGGDIYLNLDMHVDEIASDYDVDRIADRVKDILYDASSYRNVNILNFIR